MAGKESGAWFNRNVRPWYYYWTFFLETGIWSVAMITTLVYAAVKGWKQLDPFIPNVDNVAVSSTVASVTAS